MFITGYIPVFKQLIDAFDAVIRFFHDTFGFGWGLSIIALTVFRPANFSDWVHHTIAAMGGAVAIFALTILHEFKGKTDWAKNWIYHGVIYLSWVAYFFILLWLAPSAVHAGG